MYTIVKNNYAYYIKAEKRVSMGGDNHVETNTKHYDCTFPLIKWKGVDFWIKRPERKN